MQAVGFIGLGSMGAPMAWNLHKAGMALAVYNRSDARSQPFAEAGVEVCSTPAALAARSDVIVIMVSDPAALHAVIDGPDGVLAGLRPSATVINMSTVSPDATAAVAAAVAAKGGRFVDAPVSGTVKPAQDGTLVILAAGEREHVDAVTPLFQAMGKGVVYCGAVGQATHLKLVINLILAGMMELLGEGLTLAQGFGLQPERLLEALGAGPLAAPIFQMKGQAMLAGEFAKQFPVDLMFKDLNLVLQAAGDVQVALPATAAVREVFGAARALGHGDHDMAAVIQGLRHMAGRASA